MTETATTYPSGKETGQAVRRKTSLLKTDALTRRRNAAETRFKIYGVVAILIGLFFLVALLYAIFSNGLTAFNQTFVSIPVTLDREAVEKAEASVVKTSGYNAMIDAALVAELERAGVATDMRPADLRKMLSSGAAAQIRSFVLANPGRSVRR